MTTKVIFKIPHSKGECIYIVGSHSSLGNWERAKGLPMLPSHGKDKDKDVAKAQFNSGAQIVFKLCKLSNQKFEWEFGPENYNRAINLSPLATKVYVQLTFNEKTMNIDEQKFDTIHSLTPSDSIAIMSFYLPFKIVKTDSGVLSVIESDSMYINYLYSIMSRLNIIYTWIGWPQYFTTDSKE